MSCSSFFLSLCSRSPHLLFLFFFNDTATTEIYTLSLHDALPIYPDPARRCRAAPFRLSLLPFLDRSEEHTSELQSPDHLVCRLLLEKKKKRLPCPPIPAKQAWSPPRSPPPPPRAPHRHSTQRAAA